MLPPCSSRGVFRRRSERRSEVRRLRARLVTSHSGGSGTPVGRQYDRSAGSLLDERGANARPWEPRPGAERRRELMARAESGAPKGERLFAKGAPPQGGSQMRLSALRSPRFREGRELTKARAQRRREHG